MTSQSLNENLHRNLFVCLTNILKIMSVGFYQNHLSRRCVYPYHTLYWSEMKANLQFNARSDEDNNAPMSCAVSVIW